MLRVLPILLFVGIFVYALIDLATSPSDDVRVLPKLVWLLVILVLPVVGAVAWLVFGRPPATSGDDGGGGGGGGLRDKFPRPAPRGPTGYAAGPVAPDDDPDFLRKLDEQRRKAGDSD